MDYESRNSKPLNKVKALAVAFVSLLALPSGAQTLDECKQLARDNYPAIKQYGLIEKSRDLSLSNTAKAWLPGVSVSGMGVGFTNLIDLPAQSGNLSGDMKKYVFGASVTVKQKLYDGGAIAAQKEIANAKADVERQQLEVTLYEINERVEQLYFGVLTIDEQLSQLRLLEDNLKISEKSVKSLMNGGMANESDLEAVQVNQIQVEQQEVSLQEMRKSYCNMLGYFIGKELTADCKLEKPEAVLVDAEAQPTRQELNLFASQEALLNAQKRALDARLKPTLGAFGMANLHSTVVPMVNNQFLVGGLVLGWNIGSLYTRNNDLTSIENQRQQIAVKKDVFLFNNQLQGKQSNSRLECLRKQMELDDRAVELRENILKKARKKVELGTETVNELLRDVNAVSEARQQKAIHEMEFLKEIYKLKTIQGK